MTKKRDLDREGLEVYMLHALLSARPLLQLIGYLFLIYAVATLFSSTKLSLISFGVVILIIIYTYSYQAVLYLAKFGAWLGTR
ncbi:MAG: hypothetical protein ABFS03_13530, partial [Chloroflexota bacterium]